MNSFTCCGMKVIQSDLCLQVWQLKDFTKELMGPEWVKKFEAWAEYSLPKQPACYVIQNGRTINGRTLVAHPEIVKIIRTKEQ